MSARYAPVPNVLPPNADRELDAAFEHDDEDEDEDCGETTRLNPRPSSSERGGVSRTSVREGNDEAGRSVQRVPTLPGAYDFEADPFEYTAPPPGSPPRASTSAPLNQYGNSNEVISSDPNIPLPRGRRRGFIRRVVGALLPSHYQSVPTEDDARVGPARGGGMNNDGVFANITAKPGRGVVVQDGESIHVVPEDVQKDAPPSYAVAQADAAPAYYETIIHAPTSGLDGEVLVDGMPTGSIFTFAWTMLISISFQFVGFLLTYVLHTTHAAKFGSRGGLGITIIQYAYFLRRRALLTAKSVYNEPQEPNRWWDSSAPNPRGDSDTFMSDFNGTAPDALLPPTHNRYHGHFSPATIQWLSFLLMSFGWILLVASLLGFWRVKRWEYAIRQANEPLDTMTGEDMAREASALSNIYSAFAAPVSQTEDEPEPGIDADGNDEESQADAQLARDLRATGLL